MKHEAKIIAAVAAMLYATGCTRSMTSNSLQTDTMSVSVQFVIPSEQQQLAYKNDQTSTQLAADSPYSGFDHRQGTNMPQDWSPHVQHVALWGGPHNGTDVTMHPTALPPGSYTFAFFDQPNEAVMQGWMDVQNNGNDLVGILSNWKDTLSQQKQRLAYDFEIDGRTRVSDPTVFKSFKKQVKAYDQLERQVQKTLNAELKSQTMQKNQIADLLSHSDIVIMPGDENFFRPTSQPTFNESELETVRNGDIMTKLVMAADYEVAQWKLQHVQQLYGDLSRFKEVLKQEADRLERQKGLFLLTDHLYHHDKRFVENEMRLQNTLGMIDRCEDRAMELRERRLGLAFITSLFTPDTSLEPFDAEEKSLRSERTVLKTDLGRLDALANATDQNSVKRVAIERNRQRVMAMVDSLNDQMEEVDQARMTMMAMAASTNVIHRHNDMRLLTTTLVSDEVPYNLLQTIKHQAMMTVRLEMTDKIYVPRPKSITTASLQQAPASTYEPHTPSMNQTSQTNASDSSFDQTHATTSAQPQQTPNRPSHPTMHRPVSQPAQKFTQRTVSQPVQKVTQRHTSKPVQQKTRRSTPQTTQRVAQRTTQHDVARTVQKPMQPSKHGTAKKPSYKHTQTTQKTPTKTSTSLVSQRNQPSAQKSSNEDCPWYVKLLVPPCWITSMEKQEKTAKKEPKRRKTTLAAKRARPSKMKDNTNEDCHWLAKLLVPPCWITSMEKQGKTAKKEPKRRKTTLAAKKARPSKTRDNTNKDCHWLAKLFVPPCWISKSKNGQPVTQNTRKQGTRLTGQSQGKNQSDDKECTCWLAKVFVPSCWFYNSKDGGQVAKKNRRNEKNANSKDGGQVAKKSRRNKKNAKLARQSNDADDNASKECSCWLAKIFVPSCWCYNAIKKAQASNNCDHNSRTKLTSQRSPSTDAQNDGECHWLAKLLVPPCWSNNSNQR